MSKLVAAHFIDTLLQHAELIDIIDKQVPLKKAGANYKGLCPFHNEKTPSFTVYPQQQTYHCYGCGAHGNAITFLREHNHLDFNDAVEELAGNCGLEVEYDDNIEVQPVQVKNDNLYTVLQQVTQFYQQQLQLFPISLDYFKQRGLNADIIEQYALGYAPQAWDNVLKQFGTDAQKIQQLIDVGLISEKQESQRRYDRFRHRVMFPIHDQKGQVIAYGGRVLDDSKPKYLNSPETALFQKKQELYGWHLVKKQKNLQRVVIVEGYMDVVVLAQFDVMNAVATLGTATSIEHLNRLFRTVPEIIFCFDGDSAGYKAAKRALEVALPVLFDGRKIRFAFLPDGEDPDSFVRQYGKAQFETYLNQAKLLSGFLFDEYLLNDIDPEQPHTPESIANLKRTAEKNVIPLLEQLPKNSEYYRLMFKRLEEISANLGFEGANFKKSSKLTKNKQTQSENKRASKSIPSLAEKALRLLIQMPSLAEEVEQVDKFQYVQDEKANLLIRLVEFIHQNPHVNTAIMLEHWQNTKELNYLTSLSLNTHLLSEQEILQEFTSAIEQLQYCSSVRQRKQSLLEKIKQGIATASEQQALEQLYKDEAQLFKFR
ncbi:DNA primase [Candidatus Albibeggiatoa sp. nov. BB20]|uniref:DNA primase n=1 Tax=Candidatus Albibeggiatoa sp. nov. BB20 TaxID=3162723 RepID=UPI0033658763